MLLSSKSCSGDDLSERKISPSHQLTLYKRFNSEVKAKLKQLRKLLKEQDVKCWEIGDLCVELKENHYIPLRDIADKTNYSKARICHFHLTAREFNSEQRAGFTFQDSLTARQIKLRLPNLGMSSVEIRDVIVKMRNKTPRQVKGYFLELLYEREQNYTLAQSIRASVEGGEITNRCYNMDWRNVVPNLPDRSVKLFIADPPFGGYNDTNEGGYLSYRAEASPMRTECDNNTTEDALAVTLPLFELCLPKLADNGVLLLFQAGGKSDRPEVLIEADRCGWSCDYALTWQKGLLTSGNNYRPYRVCSERILVFCRKGEAANKNQDGFPVSDILNYPTETRTISNKMENGSMPIGDYHIFQKPFELMDCLIGRHSYPGELVCSVFGCSGVDILAAIKLRRQWVYIESNGHNYNWGAQRIGNALAEQNSLVS